MSFWKELKRYNVYKVGVAHALVERLLMQVAAIVFLAFRVTPIILLNFLKEVKNDH